MHRKRLDSYIFIANRIGCFGLTVSAGLMMGAGGIFVTQRL